MFTLCTCIKNCIRYKILVEDHKDDIQFDRGSDRTNVSSTSYQILIRIVVDVLRRFVTL